MSGYPSWWRRRLDPDHRLGLRLVVASGAVVGLAVPFVVLALLVAAAWDPLLDLDESTADRLHVYALAHPAWVHVLKVATTVFAPWTFRVLVLLLAGWLVYQRAPRLAAWAVTAMITGGVLGPVAKSVVDRSRPYLADPVAYAPGPAFPSGHALNATLGCGVILLVLLPVLPGRRVRALGWALAATVALGTSYTRVALGVHWLSDVLGGILLGAAVLLATAAAFETWRARDAGRRAVSPLREGVEPVAAE
jgi:membrane-associated phospholipid phosphatase